MFRPARSIDPSTIHSRGESMIRRFTTASAVVALVLAWASLVPAQSTQPERIAFQGRLTGADGNPVTNGALSMTFSIYASSSAPFGSYL
jgi:hypothetical protein